MLDWTAEYFREHGSDQARLEAEILLAEAMDCPRIELYTRFNEEPSDQIKGVFRDWVARHAEGEPVAYLVGHKEFFSLKFAVNSSVLIPRPETEHLVTEVLDAIKELGDGPPVNVIDVGTGSGCVAVAVSKHASHITLTASDLSEAALVIARQNAAAHGVEERIRFVQADLLEGIDQPELFDVIVSNPPYIGLSEKDDLDRSVVEFEPHEALFSSGPEGTETIQRLLQQAGQRLQPNGWLMFEISPMIADRCQELVESTTGLALERIAKDLSGHQRIVLARRSS